jgi:hypothetical protein
MIVAVLSGEGALSRSNPDVGQSESWPDRGPGTADEARGRRWSAGRRSAFAERARAALQLGRARWVGNPASKGCVAHTPGASRRSTPSRLSRGTWQTSDALRRENAQAWLFEIWIGRNEAHGRATFTAVIARLDRATQYLGLVVIHTNGGDYWFPASAGMTILPGCNVLQSRAMISRSP